MWYYLFVEDQPEFRLGTDGEPVERVRDRCDGRESFNLKGLEQITNDESSQEQRFVCCETIKDFYIDYLDYIDQYDDKTKITKKCEKAKTSFISLQLIYLLQLHPLLWPHSS